MKKSICTIGFILLGSLVFASTTQQGIVKTKGRLNEDQTITKGVPLPDAFVTVQGAQTVSSNKKGLFSVTLTSKDYYLKDVTKEGYVLCDADALSHSYAYSPNPIYIVMETPAQQMEDKLIAERKLRRTLQRQLTQREEEIDSLKTKQQISDEEYRQQLQQIYAEQEENERLIKEMADRYASIDYDQLDEFNRQISALILEGKFTEADSLIRTKGDITSRIETLKEHQDKNQQEEQALKKRMKALEKSKAYTQKELEDLAQDCYSLYEIFKMQHKNDSAAYYLELRASLDTTNVEWQLDIGYYFDAYFYDAEKALYYYNIALQQSYIQYGYYSSNVASSYVYIGYVYYKQNKYNEALEFNKKAIEIVEKIKGESLSFMDAAYNNTGLIYDDLGNYSQAIEYYLKALKIFVADNNKNGLIKTYSNIGASYGMQKEYASALEYYNKALDIERKTQGENRIEVVTIYNNIATIYSNNNKIEQALDLYHKSLDVLTEIFGSNHPLVAGSLNNIGKALYRQKKYDEAYVYYKQSLMILERIFDNNMRLAIIYYNIGELLCDTENYVDALFYMKKSDDIFSLYLPTNHPNFVKEKNKLQEIEAALKDKE